MLGATLIVIGSHMISHGEMTGVLAIIAGIILWIARE
jgi:hypothetical protein